MTIREAFAPVYTKGITVTPAAASANAEFGKGSKSVQLHNTGAAICYIRIGTGSTLAATTADYALPAGALRILSKAQDDDRLAYISAAGTTLNAIPGEGGI